MSKKERKAHFESLYLNKLFCVSDGNEPYSPFTRCPSTIVRLSLYDDDDRNVIDIENIFGHKVMCIGIIPWTVTMHRKYLKSFETLQDTNTKKLLNTTFNMTAFQFLDCTCHGGRIFYYEVFHSDGDELDFYFQEIKS